MLRLYYYINAIISIYKEKKNMNENQGISLNSLTYKGKNALCLII